MNPSRTLAAATLLLASAAASAQEWRAKVEPGLLQRAEAGETAEFMVMLREQADLSGAAPLRSRPEKTRFVFDALRGTAARTQPPLLALLRSRGLEHRAFWISNAIRARGTLADLEAIALREEVRSLHLLLPPMLPLPASSKSMRGKADPIGIEPALTLVGAPDVWALGFRGQGVVVADHDVGVQWDHPALINQYRGWDGTMADHRYNWFNAFVVDPYCSDRSVPCDSNGHGTHTTGTMVGDDGAGNQIGMAPAAQWIGCRSLLDPILGLGTVPTYLACMEWTLAPYPTDDPSAADPARAPDLVSNSWGCVEACAPPVLQSTNDAVRAAGIVQVASAGNEGSNCGTIAFPLAVYESTFTVGATDNEDQMAGFSSRGPVLTDGSLRIKPNVVAPGVDTYSSWIDSDYASISGTSMAAPHVAGLVALLFSAEPKLIGQVDQVESLIEATAIPIVTDQACLGTGPQDIPNSVFGYGRIDALAAVQARPQLVVVASAPATAPLGAEYQYLVGVSQPATAQIAVSNVELEVALPPGVAIVDASEPPAAGLRFERASLAPGDSWIVSLTLRASATGAKRVDSQAEADQVSTVAGNAVTTEIVGAGGASATAGEPRFGGGSLSVLAGLLAGLLARLRRRS